MLLFILTVIGRAQSRVPAQPDAIQLVSELSKQVHELRIEVASLRLALQEQRVQSLEKELSAAESDRRLAEYDEAAVREDIETAEIQLAGSELDAAERAELMALKNTLLTDSQQRAKGSRAELAERESALRSELDREKRIAEGFRRTLTSLRGDAATVPQ